MPQTTTSARTVAGCSAVGLGLNLEYGNWQGDNWKLATGNWQPLDNAQVFRVPLACLRLKHCALQQTLHWQWAARHATRTHRLTDSPTRRLTDSRVWQGSTMASASSIRSKEWQRNCNGIFECEVGGMALHCAHCWLPHSVATLGCYACPCPCSTSWQGRQVSQVTHFEDLLSDKQQQK